RFILQRLDVPPRPPPFPYTTLFRSHRLFGGEESEQTNFYTGETWLLTHDHVAALAELETTGPRDAERYRVWLQTADETLDYRQADRKSTRLNSSHVKSSYAVFCLKK